MGIIGIITKNKSSKGCLRLGLFPLMLISNNHRIKLILHEGTTKVIKRRMKIKAGEIMFQFPDSVVCHADSFFLGKPIPILSIHDHLVAGHTYFIIPLDRLPGQLQNSPGSGNGTTRGSLLSAASLCLLGSPSGGCPNPRPPPTLVKLLNNGDNNNKGSPFNYVKDKDGRVIMIKVVPEFITKIITSNYGIITSPNDDNKSIISAKLICSTPELKKQYEQLVRAKDQAWSPKLETITEHKIRFSPSRLLRLDWKL
ncbi:uncharacterized protein LOC141622617 [Silene latifolia]|uniref:uncharacterized protein LOC141622617 n=1 Tax=Silene latifolia TaxID=37657 RepID=UPI003D783D0E